MLCLNLTAAKKNVHMQNEKLTECVHAGLSTELCWKKMDAKEIESFAALAEESSKTDKSCGLLFDVAVRDPATIFHHDLGCSGRTVLHCNCTFARMNFDEMIALESALQSGLDVRSPQETVCISLAARENQILSNVASFYWLGTEARAGKLHLLKPLSALQMMTTGDEA